MVAGEGTQEEHMKIWRLLADVNRYACFADHPTLSLEEILSIDGRSLAHA